MTQRNPEFTARLARIERRKRTAAPSAAPRRALSDRLYPLSLVAAFVVGMLVVFAARYARFHLTGMAPGAAGAGHGIPVIDLALAFLAGFILHQMFQFRRPEHTGAKTFGMVICAVTMHMPVHQFPGLFTVMFSEEWVHQVLRLTEPGVPALF